MQIKLIVAAAGLAAVALPLAVFASQPPASLGKLKPSLQTAQVLSLLVLDPYENTELAVRLPTRHTVLEVDSDPFAR
ncbi:hypothetical protein PRN20_00290 [Devosia sp. ZB163]|uniref:hypothetical protein n=1 Tax=Devosia sp. ZB163 TaxID=3025938 RepID=UPI0023620420|nr:hypothetical protein [Devosia sp. ZB163]MDC9822155.1 hypothetical protein [Devosia sp. ZB163]